MPPTRSVIAAALVLSLGLAVVLSLSLELHHLRESLRRDVLDEAHVATHLAAAEIERNHIRLVDLVHRLASDLGSGDLSPTHIDRRLTDEVRAWPQVFAIAVPLPPESAAPLVVPAILRSTGGHQLARLDHRYDVRRSEWFSDVAAHPEPGWHGPFLAPVSGHFVAYYCEPWSYPAATAPTGHVCGAWSLYEIEALRQTLPAGRFGYTWLLSHEARSLAHPAVDWLRSARTPDQIAEQIGDPRLREVGRLAIAGRDGVVHATDPLTHRDAVMFQEPIATSGWSLVAVVLQDAILAAEPTLRRRRIDITIALLASLVAASTAALLGGRR